MGKGSRLSTEVRQWVADLTDRDCPEAGDVCGCGGGGGFSSKDNVGYLGLWL